MFKKKNIPLILGFSIPVLMIIFVAASIYVPGIFSKPKYNFLYSTDGDYFGSQNYSVESNKVVLNPRRTPYDTYPVYPTPKLYIHDVTTNKSSPISFQNAQFLKLDASEESPDGYKLENGINHSDGFFPLFWYSSDNNQEYLVGHNTSKKLELTHGTTYYSVHFLGWIMK